MLISTFFFIFQAKLCVKQQENNNKNNKKKMKMEKPKRTTNKKCEMRIPFWAAAPAGWSLCMPCNKVCVCVT